MITSKENPKIKELKKILKNPKKDAFLVEGFHLVEEALKSGALKEVFSLEPYPFNKVTLINEKVLKEITESKTPEGIVGLVSLNETKQESDEIVFLDRVQDPGNLGTIERSMAAFSFPSLALSRGTVKPFNSKTLMASQGAIFKLNIEDNIEAIDYLKKKKEDGYVIISTALKDSEDLRTFKTLPKKYILIMGNEGQGISDDILNISDKKLYIPSPGMESLNVGVSFGIMAFYLRNLVKE